MNIEAKININIPEGYDYVGFGIVPHDGIYLHHNTMKPINFNASAPPSGPRFIVKKKPVYRKVQASDVKPGKSVRVAITTGSSGTVRDTYCLVGWIGNYAIIHDPTGPYAVNLTTCDPDYLFIEE